MAFFPAPLGSSAHLLVHNSSTARPLVCSSARLHSCVDNIIRIRMSEQEQWQMCCAVLLLFSQPHLARLLVCSSATRLLICSSAVMTTSHSGTSCTCTSRRSIRTPGQGRPTTTRWPWCALRHNPRLLEPFFRGIVHGHNVNDDSVAVARKQSQCEVIRAIVLGNTHMLHNVDQTAKQTEATTCPAVLRKQTVMRGGSYNAPPAILQRPFSCDKCLPPARMPWCALRHNPWLSGPFCRGIIHAHSLEQTRLMQANFQPDCYVCFSSPLWAFFHGLPLHRVISAACAWRAAHIVVVALFCCLVHTVLCGLSSDTMALITSDCDARPDPRSLWVSLRGPEGVSASAIRCSNFICTQSPPKSNSAAQSLVESREWRVERAQSREQSVYRR